MLTKEQKDLAKNYFKLGFSDVAITEKLGLPAKSIYVFQFRKKLGIEASEILQNRHQAFLDLASKGMSDKDIASIFGAKARSVYVTLCSYGFSRKEQKREAKELIGAVIIPKKYAKVAGEALAKPKPAAKKATKPKAKTK